MRNKDGKVVKDFHNLNELELKKANTSIRGSASQKSAGSINSKIKIPSNLNSNLGNLKR